MAEETPPALPRKPARQKSNGPLARLWRRVRKPLASSTLVKNVLASAIAGFLRLTERTNRFAAGSASLDAMKQFSPRPIFALWHGQHIMAPTIVPRWYPMVALFSRSADAELNALVCEKFGVQTVRGSGGREGVTSHDKGGARALIALKKALDQGKSVTMIADIPHGTPREAGLGVIMLARISGRPIVGTAFATSRRKVLEKSWDKTTINLPFGRIAITFAEPIYVPATATEAEMEAYRVALTDAMNANTKHAYDLVDRPR